MTPEGCQPYGLWRLKQWSMWLVIPVSLLNLLSAWPGVGGAHHPAFRGRYPHRSRLHAHRRAGAPSALAAGVRVTFIAVDLAC